MWGGGCASDHEISMLHRSEEPTTPARQPEVSPKHKPTGPPPQPPKRTASLLSEEITPPRDEAPPTTRMVLYDDLLKDEDYSGQLGPDVEAALRKESGHPNKISFFLLVF